MRFKLSPVQGVCVSFWGRSGGKDGFLETDIFETFGSPYRLSHNMHLWKDGHSILLDETATISNYAPGTENLVPFGEEYHTIGWEWEDDISRFYVDGKQTVTFDSSGSKYDVFNKSLWLILAVSPSKRDYGSTNPLPDDFKSATVTYDWIHLYQKDNGAILEEKGPE